jgi:hypothetical protein
MTWEYQRNGNSHVICKVKTSWARVREAKITQTQDGAQHALKKNMWVKKFPVKVWEVFFQSQVRFNTVSEKVPEKVPNKVRGGFGEEPGDVQDGSGDGSG